MSEWIELERCKKCGKFPNLLPGLNKTIQIFCCGETYHSAIKWNEAQRTDKPEEAA